MLERISDIQGIGLLHQANGKPFTCKNATLIYGDNGRGKSTLATILRSVATGDPLIISGCKTIDGTLPVKVNLQFGNGHLVSFQNGAWTERRPELLVFDAQALVGALGELEDNINLHSEKAASGILVYSTDSGMLEFVVSDTGIGVLESLRKNPEFSTLIDSGTALSIAIADGNSRFDRTSGHGLGIGQLFRALAGYEGEVRFRSGDHALTLSGRNPSQNGTLKLARKANLAGLTISVICGTPRLPSG